VPGTVAQYLLPFSKPKDFNVYVHWLRSATVMTKKHSSGSMKANGRRSAAIRYNNEYTQLGRLYGLGERLRDNSFCNAIVDAFLGALRESTDVAFDDDWEDEDVHIILPDAKTIKSIWTDAVNHNNSLK